MSINHDAHQETVRELIDRAAEADGVCPFSEQFLLGLDDDRLGHEHTLLRTEEGVVAVAARDGHMAEMAVDPDYRGDGRGETMLKELLSEVDPDPITIWAHGDTKSAQNFAAKNGGQATRELLVMEVAADGWEEAAGGVEKPSSLEELSLSESRERFGAERADAEWLRVNNEAFDWHPEQGGWDEDRLARAQEVEWFDPDGVRMLWEGETLAGFHWTKLPPEGKKGEVYVVGLGDAYRGRGLGLPLIAAGLRYLTEKKATALELYVEADNRSAVAAYERLGFHTSEIHKAYTFGAPSGEMPETDSQ